MLVLHTSLDTPVGTLHLYAAEGKLVRISLPNEARPDGDAWVRRHADGEAPPVPHGSGDDTTISTDQAGSRRRRTATAIVELDAGGDDDPESAWVLRVAAAQLSAYFAGERHTFDLPLDPWGTPFQRAVWAAVAAVPFGTTCSYRDIAHAIGQPAAVRAVGAANGANPLPLVVPCHRVVGANGSLTGYGGGLDLKRRLLDFERGQLTLATTGPGWR